MSFQSTAAVAQDASLPIDEVRTVRDAAEKKLGSSDAVAAERQIRHSISM